MRHRILISLSVAMLYGCTDQPPTGPQTRVGGGGVHLGAFAGANGRIAFTGDGIQTMTATGSDVQTVTADGNTPAYSPDGKRIAFIRHDGSDNEIWVMNEDGTNQVRLTDNNDEDGGPAWSADGLMIGYNSTSGGVTQIYTISPDGGSATLLPTGDGSNFTPSWSPDGTKIAFTSTRDGHHEIYVANADGSNPVRLTNDPVEWSYDASWSPDGAKIAYTRGGAFPDIYVMNSDGSNPVNLTNTTDAEASASWSPDGTRIVYRRDVSGISDIFVMNVNGSGQTNITNTTGIGEVLPDWQPIPGPTVSQQIQDLINYLDGLGLPKNVVNPLKSPLLNALSAANANDTAQTCSYIADFINKTTAQSAKKLNPDVAADLIQRARAISDTLGCTVPASKCYVGLPAPQLVLESTTVEEPNVRFEFNVSNYASFPNELFAQAPDLPPCGLNTKASRTWVDVYDGNDNRLFGFCTLGQSSDLNGVWFQVPTANWPAEAYIKLTDRRCNITYTSNKVNMASIF